MKNITITDISEAYAERGGITKKEAKERVEDVIGLVKDAIMDCANDCGDKVFLHGFGSFRATVKPGRTMTSNLDGETHEVPDKFVVKFKPAADLLTQLNGL